jgi:glutathione S-transferase
MENPGAATGWDGWRMDRFPLTSLVTLLACGVFFWTLAVVAGARGRYGVEAPAVSGHEQFERCFRVQNNTLEQLLFMLPILWLCAFWVADWAAALGGLVWSAARVLYARAYIADPKTRGLGFMLSVTASCVMGLAVILAILRSAM